MALQSTRPMAPEKAAAMASALAARSYEIQRYSANRWVVESVSDEKDVAMAMAKSLLKSGRASSGVRVMAIQTKPNGDFSQITLFKSMPGEPVQAEAPKPKVEAKPAVQAETEHRDFKHVERPSSPSPQKSRLGTLVLSLKIAFALGFVLVAFETLRILAR